MFPLRRPLTIALAALLIALAASLGAWAGPDPDSLPDMPLPLETRPSRSPSPEALPSPAASPEASPVPPPRATPSPEKPPRPATLNAAPVRSGFTPVLDLRIAPEVYDFFAPPTPRENAYGFLGVRARPALTYTGKNWDARLQIQNVLALGLPERGVAPPPAGSLGQGGAYYGLALRPTFDTLGVRQLFVRIGAPTGALGAPTGSALKVGRFDYSGGMEVAAQDGVIDWLKRERVSRRVIGQPDYNIFSRTFDGLRGDLDLGPAALTVFGGRPTQAEPHFAVEAHSVQTINAALTVKQGTWLGPAEAQLFYNHLDDTRQVPQIDDRPAAVRKTIAAEGGDHVDTLGGHYVTHLGANGDLCVWYAHQTGRWGGQRQSADALMGEVGLQWPEAPLKPWVRAGYSIFSGDRNPTDGVHGTFAAELADPRQRLNMYGYANLSDIVGQVLLTVTPQLSLRADYHLYQLAASQDLWYSGSGVTQQKGANGITGRPSGGSADLGRMLETIVGYKLDARNMFTLRWVNGWGGPVVRASFPRKTNANMIILQYDLSL